MKVAGLLLLGATAAVAAPASTIVTKISGKLQASHHRGIAQPSSLSRPAPKHVDRNLYRGPVVDTARLDIPSAAFNVSSASYNGWLAGMHVHNDRQCWDGGKPGFVSPGSCWTPLEGSASIQYLVNGSILYKYKSPDCSTHPIPVVDKSCVPLDGKTGFMAFPKPPTKPFPRVTPLDSSSDLDPLEKPLCGYSDDIEAYCCCHHGNDGDDKQNITKKITSARSLLSRSGLKFAKRSVKEEMFPGQNLTKLSFNLTKSVKNATSTKYYFLDETTITEPAPWWTLFGSVSTPTISLTSAKHLLASVSHSSKPAVHASTSRVHPSKPFVYPSKAVATPPSQVSKVTASVASVSKPKTIPSNVATSPARPVISLTKPVIDAQFPECTCNKRNYAAVDSSIPKVNPSKHDGTVAVSARYNCTCDDDSKISFPPIDIDIDVDSNITDIHINIDESPEDNTSSVKGSNLSTSHSPSSNWRVYTIGWEPHPSTGTSASHVHAITTSASHHLSTAIHEHSKSYIYSRPVLRRPGSAITAHSSTLTPHGVHVSWSSSSAASGLKPSASPPTSPSELTRCPSDYEPRFSDIEFSDEVDSDEDMDDFWSAEESDGEGYEGHNKYSCACLEKGVLKFYHASDASDNESE